MKTQKTYKIKNLKNFFKLPRKTKFKSKKEIEENVVKRKMALQWWQEFMDLYKWKKKETALIVWSLQKDLQVIFPEVSVFDEDFDEKVFVYISLAMMKLKWEIEFFRDLQKNSE